LVKGKVTSMPRALLVYPEFPPSYWDFRYALELLGKRAPMPPLGLLTVAAMFPESWELRVSDLNVEPLGDTDLGWADLVLTSTMVVQQRSLREVLGRCNALGRPVAVGGPHPTSFASEISGADHLLLDEVEETFPRFLADWEAGRAAREYRPESKPAWQREHGYPFDLYTEASVNLARNEPLMDAMVEAGFSIVFLGIESPNPEALRRTNLP
jgi:radical SAM superfamily enzyme YgiQ (UPF0313 family)